MPPDLRTVAGRAELERAIAMIEPTADLFSRTSRLRALVEPETAAVALTQYGLRQRGVAKFGSAALSMYFTPDGLEQSSRTEVAAHRARRFAAADRRDVLDLCCGIGADSLAFARAGLQVSGVELDPATAEICAANFATQLASHVAAEDESDYATTTPGRARVTVGRAQDANRRVATAVFLDPARRGSAGRTLHPAAYSPPFTFATEILAGTDFAAVKLAPGLDHHLIPAEVEAEWVSYGGGVKEAVLWSRGFAEPGIRRRASVLTRRTCTPHGRDADLTAAQLTDRDPAQTAIADVGAYLYEPDGAVIRAGLVQQLAALLPGGRRIDKHLAYLSCDAQIDTELAVCFKVLDVIDYSVSRLRAELRRRKVGIVEIKKRGVDIDPAALRKQLKPTGPYSISVLLARVGERRLAILADRVQESLTSGCTCSPHNPIA